MSRLPRRPRSPVITLLVILVLLAVVLPSFNGYRLQLTTNLLINVILVSSFRFITTMGRWSFAHVALAGVGGYTSAILVMDYGVPFAITLLCGGVAAAVVASVLSVPTLRTNDFYFLMSTFAAAGLIVWTWNNVIDPFGGTSGKYGVPRPGPFGAIDFGTQLGYAYLATLVSAACLLILIRLEQSRFGTIMKGIRWQTSVAQSVGVNVRWYETVAFMTGSFVAGVAGVLFVHYQGIAFPGSFASQPTINILMFVVVGGVEKFWGPPLGAAVMTLIGQGIQEYPSLVPYTSLVFGAITIVIVLLLPDGLVELPRVIRRRLRNKRVAPGLRQGEPA